MNILLIHYSMNCAEPYSCRERVAAEKTSSYGIMKGEQVNHSFYRLSDVIEKPTLQEARSV